MQNLFDLAVTVNGTRYEHAVEPRTLLSDFLRHDLGLTGTHVGLRAWRLRSLYGFIGWEPGSLLSDVCCPNAWARSYYNRRIGNN